MGIAMGALAHGTWLALSPLTTSSGSHVMKNKDTQPAVDLSFARSASESPPSPLAAAGRRRTQEQGQGDLDDDRQDAPPVEASQGPAADPDPSDLISKSSVNGLRMDLHLT
ncbi:MAG TPA: hypothetical protein VFO28_14115 [Burkholderiaceae bacterium]|nr:hypothetical protein [Burkholderiaceae bacterium]